MQYSKTQGDLNQEKQGEIRKHKKVIIYTFSHFTINIFIFAQATFTD